MLCGGVAAMVNLGVRFLLSMALSFPAAIVLAYLSSMVVAFFLFKIVVFRRQERGTVNEVISFVLVNIFAMLQILVISIFLADWLLPLLGWDWRRRDVAHFAGVLVPAFTSYLGHKHFTFKKGRTCA